MNTYKIINRETIMVKADRFEVNEKGVLFFYRAKPTRNASGFPAETSEIVAVFNVECWLSVQKIEDTK